jgi:hypothetical protein
MFLTLGTNFDYTISGKDLLFNGDILTTGDLLTIQYSF